MSGDVTAHVVVRRPGGLDLDVELVLPAGRTTALLGPNGAGKSTTIAALAGLEPVDSGRVVLGDRVVDDATDDVFVPARDRRVGVVFQDGLLFGHMTVLENVAFGPRSDGLDRRAAVRVATDWLHRLEVGHLAGRRPPGLSGGEAQRVAIARALACDPDLVLLDEPLSALDVSGRAGLRRLLAAHLGSLAAPRLLVTHDPVEAFLLADRVAVIEDGRITQTGTPEELRARPTTRYAADLAGTNLLRGTAEDRLVEVGEHVLEVADSTVSGPVLVTVHPHAVAIALDAPSGSPRNTWRTTVDRVEHLGDRVRITVGAPLPLTAEVTPGAVEELDLAPGTDVWVAIKATEITTSPDAG